MARGDPTSGSALARAEAQRTFDELLAAPTPSAAHRALASLLGVVLPRANGMLRKRFSSFNEQDREDVLQEAVARLWSAREKCKKDKGGVLPYFLRIVHNLAVEKIRKDKRSRRSAVRLEEIPEPTVEIKGGDEAQEPVPQFAAVQACLNEMTPSQRRILLASAEGEGYAQRLAPELGQPPSTIRSIACRLRDRFRRWWQNRQQPQKGGNNNG